MNRTVLKILLATALLACVVFLFLTIEGKQLAFLILSIIFSFCFLVVKISGKKLNGILLFSVNSTKIGLFLPYLNKTLILGSLFSGIVFKVSEGSQGYYIIVTILILSLLFMIPLSLNMLLIQRSGLSYPMRWSVEWDEVVDFKIDLPIRKLIVNLKDSGERVLYFKNSKDLENVQGLIQDRKSK